MRRFAQVSLPVRELFLLLVTLVIFFACADLAHGERCSHKEWLLARVNTFECPQPGESAERDFCCGSILQRTCCTLAEKRIDDERYTSTSKAILSVIVTGITLIFIGFTIGWIYSCYLFTRAPDELPEIDANGRPINGYEDSNTTGERNLLLNIIGRYFNLGGLNYARDSNQASIFAISPLNDKPPPYSSLFMAEQATVQNESKLRTDRSCFRLDGSSARTSRPLNGINSNDYEDDELPPPSYSYAIRLSDYRN